MAKIIHRGPDGLTKRERELLTLFEKNPGISIAECAKRQGVSYGMSFRWLTSLKRLGKIQPINNRIYTTTV